MFTRTHEPVGSKALQESIDVYKRQSLDSVIIYRCQGGPDTKYIIIH